MQVYNEGEFNMIPLAMNAFYYNIPFVTKNYKKIEQIYPDAQALQQDIFFFCHKYS